MVSSASNARRVVSIGLCDVHRAYSFGYLHGVAVSTLVLIQARDGGTRLPGKINMDIAGSPMLAHVAARVSLTGLPFLIAKPEPGDNENDVLSRFVRIVRRNPGYDTLMRITADCPLLDPSVVGFAANIYREGIYDFVGTHPDMDGLDVEVFSRAALLACDLAAHGIRAREHLTRWMRRNLSPYVFSWAPAPLRWSVDNREGLEFVRSVYATCQHCAQGIPHHTNAGGSIGGRDRTLVVDLHQVANGGLEECKAADILKTRMGGEAYVSR